MKSEMAGKMRSDVSGLLEMSAAVAKLLNPTSTGECTPISAFNRRCKTGLRTRDTTPQSNVHGLVHTVEKLNQMLGRMIATNGEQSNFKQHL